MNICIRYIKAFHKVVFVIIISALISCDKESQDQEQPIITITSPTAGQRFISGQAVTLHAVITDNDAINEVHWHVINIGTGAHLVMEGDHPDAKSYNLETSFILPGTGNYQVFIEANDHSGNGATAEVTVSSN